MHVTISVFPSGFNFHFPPIHANAIQEEKRERNKKKIYSGCPANVFFPPGHSVAFLYLFLLDDLELIALTVIKGETHQRSSL